jgi:hypothetical protein
VSDILYRKYRAKYTIPLAVGATFTTVGFAFKIWSSYHPNILGAWITSVILLCAHSGILVEQKGLILSGGQSPLLLFTALPTISSLPRLCTL